MLTNRRALIAKCWWTHLPQLTTDLKPVTFWVRPPLILSYENAAVVVSVGFQCGHQRLVLDGLVTPLVSILKPRLQKVKTSPEPCQDQHRNKQIDRDEPVHKHPVVIMKERSGIYSSSRMHWSLFNSIYCQWFSKICCSFNHKMSKQSKHITTRL